MNKMEMISQMKKMIEADPALNISEWEATFNFVNGELVSKKLIDLNAMNIEGLPERAAGDITAVEMFVLASANCYVTSLFVLAYNEKMPLEKVQIVFSGKFAKSPFLGITAGHSGMTEPTLTLTVETSASADELKKLATTALERSPVLSSLNEPVEFIIK